MKIISLAPLALLLANCAPMQTGGDPHNSLSSFGEQLAQVPGAWSGASTTPSLPNPLVDVYEPDSGGNKMRNRSGQLERSVRHSIAPAGDYDFSFIQGVGFRGVSVQPQGGAVRVRVWQRAYQTSGPSRLIADRVVASGQTFSATATLTPQQGFLVTRVEGTQGRRLIYNITYRNFPSGQSNPNPPAPPNPPVSGVTWGA